MSLVYSLIHILIHMYLHLRIKRSVICMYITDMHTVAFIHAPPIPPPPHSHTIGTTAAYFK